MATYDPIKIIRQDIDSRFRQTLFIAQISNINHSFYTADISTAESTIPGATFLDDVNVADMEDNDLVICAKIMGKIVILGGFSPTTSTRSLHRLFGNLEVGSKLDYVSLPTNAERLISESSYSYSYDYIESSYSYSYVTSTEDYTIYEDEHAGEIRRYDRNLYLYSSSYQFISGSSTQSDFGWKFVKSDDARYLQSKPIIDSQPSVGEFLKFDDVTGGGQAWVPREITVIRPIRATMWHDEATVTVGNALAVTIFTDQAYNATWYQNAAANGDTFTNGCYLEAGIYTFSVLGRSANDRGKIDWTIDGITIVSGQDWYSASATPNVVKTVSGISSVRITTNGWHIVQGVINGQNGSSSGYVMRLTKYWFNKTDDTYVPSRTDI